MAHKKCFGLPLALLLVAGAAAIVAQSRPYDRAGEVQPTETPVSRLAGDWRASALVPLAAAGPTLPQTISDLGIAPAGARLERVLLLLEPSPQQRQALDVELENLLTPGSSEFHHWLTPSAFANRFANSANDVAAIVSWLQAHGLQVAPLPASRGWVEFSGTAAQIELAFHTQIHSVFTAAGPRLALAQSIPVPAALRPLIHGLVSLDGAASAAALTAPQPVAESPAALAAETSPARAEALPPHLATQLLHLDALHATGNQGAGETIAIAARSNVRQQDVAAFRSAFGLPANPLAVVLNGADPGLTGDRAEAVLAASWAGAAAPRARIVVVPAATTGATDGIDLSLAAIVDQPLAHTVLVGYSACEAALSEPHQAFYAALYRQAAAEGIAVIAAAGDSGPAACHAAGADAPVTTGYAVNAFASTPWNTAVSASAFGPDGSSTSLAAWSPANPADPAYAGGGGQSTAYSLPGWQSELTPRAGAARLMPDIALPTALDSGVNRGLAFCLGGSLSAAGCNLVRGGGSSAAAALFAGIAALIAEKNGPQGNLAPKLYALSRQPGIFDDVQQGSAQLPCAADSPGCNSSGQIGFSAAQGYDLATGLGSVNAQKLVTAWASPQASGLPTSATLTVTPSEPNATYNPSAQITFSASVSASGATPTGNVNFFNVTTNANLNATPVALAADGTAKLTVQGTLALGGNNIQAVYLGDATYASSTSAPVTVTTEPSATSLTVVPSTLTPSAGATITATATLAVVSPPAGSNPPTGSVKLNLDGATVATQPLATAAGVSSAKFSVTILSGGAHALQAIYSGDANYDQTTSDSVSLTVAKGATVTTLTASPSVLSPNVPETLTATLSPVNPVAGATYSITGTVNFYDGATLLGTAVVNSNSASLSNITLSTAKAHVVTAIYSGDASWTTSTSNSVSLIAVLLADTVVLAVNPSAAAPGQVVTLTATVTPGTAPATNAEQNPTGNVVFYNGTTIIGTAALAASLNNTSVATLLNATLPAGQDVLTAVYVGDLYYAAGTSNSVTINVEDFSIVPSSTNPPTDLDIIKGSSGSASFVITGLGGFNNEIQVVCAVPAQDDMTCLASPQQVTPTATVTFTVQTFASGGATTASRDRVTLWPRAAGGTAMAALLFFLLPIGRKARLFTNNRARRFMVLLLLLAGLGGAGIGCSNSATLTSNSGTPLGVVTLTITAASKVDNTVVSHSVYLSVNVLAPGSTATLQPKINRR